MKRVLAGIAAFALVVAAVALLWEQDIPPQLPSQAEPAPPVPEQNASPAIRYPVPDTGDAGAALPALAQSDAELLAALVALWRPLGAVLYPENIVRHIVVTVDNLPRETAAARMRPVKPVPGAFRTSKTSETSPQGQRLLLADANAERYVRYVGILEAIDPGRLVAVYLRFYPLFQKAYRELGYPNGYFNDRLIAVIDHLLDAPDAGRNPELVQPRVLYEFADPDLQQASAGHKIMIRIGPENAKRVKASMEKIRARLVDASQQVRSAG